MKNSLSNLSIAPGIDNCCQYTQVSVRVEPVHTHLQTMEPQTVSFSLFCQTCTNCDMKAHTQAIPTYSIAQV